MVFPALYGRVHDIDRPILLAKWLAMRFFGVIVDYNTMSLRPGLAMSAQETSNMKTQVYNQASGGLLVLIMLTIALIAGLSESNLREEAPATNTFQLDTGLSGKMHRERLAKLDLLSAAIETVLILSLDADVNSNESAFPASDIPDSDNSPVQYD